MARQPRATVPSTSGAGVGRYSYQHSYQLSPGAMIKLPKGPSLAKPSARAATGAVKAMAKQKFATGTYDPNQYGDTWETLK